MSNSSSAFSHNCCCSNTFFLVLVGNMIIELLSIGDRYIQTFTREAKSSTQLVKPWVVSFEAMGLTNAFLIIYLAFVLVSSRTNAVRIRNNKLTSSVEKQLEIENFGLQLQNYNMLVELTGAGIGSKPVTSAYDVGDALSLQNTINEKNRSFQYPNCHPKTAMCDDHHNVLQIGPTKNK